MSSSRISRSGASYALEIANRVEQMVEIEVDRWEARGQGPSRLREEVEAAGERLAHHPYIGKPTSLSSDVYRLQLDRTPFVIFYTIDEVKRVVAIVEMMHSHDRRARRGR